MASDDAWKRQLRSLGEFIRDQRTHAQLSLRELAERTHVSNAYLSQIERGLHEPSVRVMKAIAEALHLSADALLAEAGVVSPGGGGGTEASIRADARLTAAQKRALIGVYRSYLAENVDPDEGEAGASR